MRMLLLSTICFLALSLKSFCQLTIFFVGEGSEQKIGYKDENGKIVIPAIYGGGIHQGGNEIALSQRETDKWTIFDAQTGKQISNVQYDAFMDDFGIFKNGYAAVNVGAYRDPNDMWEKIGGKWGFIDRTGKEVVPIKYDSVDFFNEGLAKVCLDGKCGFVDARGVEVIPLKYNDVQSFENGRAKVSLNGKEFHIDKKGNAASIETLEYQNISYTEALEMSKKTGKPIFIVTFNGECSRSVGLRDETLNHQDLVTYLNDNFIVIELSKDELVEHFLYDFSEPMNIDGKMVNYMNLPAIAFLDQNGNILFKYVNGQDYIRYDELLKVATEIKSK